MGGLHEAFQLKWRATAAPVLAVYAAAYRGYAGLFLRPKATPRKAAHAPAEVVEGDSAATLLGEAYRGSGALVGMLGAAVIFCAIAPHGFALSGAAALVFVGAELAMMVLIVAILLHTRRLKMGWVQARQQAELNRYQPLKLSLAGDIGGVAAALAPLLGGEHCQIRYNQQKHVQYQRMEHTANTISMAGFSVAMLGAATHLVVHASWLIFLTAFLPAAVGALHGINAFLQIGQLGDEHRVLGLELGRLSASFREARARGDETSARAEAEAIYDLLIEGHARWLSVAERVQVRAP